MIIFNCLPNQIPYPLLLLKSLLCIAYGPMATDSSYYFLVSSFHLSNICLNYELCYYSKISCVIVLVSVEVFILLDPLNLFEKTNWSWMMALDSDLTSQMRGIYHVDTLGLLLRDNET